MTRSIYPFRYKPAAFMTVAVLLFLSVPAASLGGMKIVIRNPAGQEVGGYGESHALLVGVSKYTNGWPSLESVPGELESAARQLEAQKFSVRRVLNPDSEQLKDAYEKFISDYGFYPENRLLFFFSGHGHSRMNGTKGYIVPADAPDPKKDEVGFLGKAIGMDQIITWARKIEAKHALFLFDSCFSGTVFRTKDGLPRTPPHITDYTARPVRQFITAGSAEEKVPARSIFTPAFVRALEGEGDLNDDGYVTGTELGMHLHDQVTYYTNRAQTPQYGKIRDIQLDRGDFVFLVKEKDEGAETARLYVNTDPEGARVWILNIGPVFEQGMVLSPGRYEIETSAGGCETLTQWVSLSAGRDEYVDVALECRGKDRFVNSLGMEFVRIPAGSFMMGSPEDEPGRAEDETSDETQHRVILTRDFYMGTTEVTQAQWKAVMGENPSKYDACGDDCPVESVSWNDIQEFIETLNQRETERYRLPTEAEWEYAARAGTKTPFAFGRCLSTDQANYGAHSPLKGCPKGAYRGEMTPVASYSPNEWGLYDMHGNVGELCQDWYGYYPEGSVTDPEGFEVDLYPESGLYPARVYRGGSWNSPGRLCRSAQRLMLNPIVRHQLIGFRLARSYP